MKRILSVLLTLLFLLPALASCGEPASPVSPGESGAPDGTQTELPTEPVSTETPPETEEPEEPVDDLVLIADGVAAVLCRPKGTGIVRDSGKAIANAVAERFGVSPQTTVDSVKKGQVKGETVSEETEILLGETTRVESRQAFEELGPGEFTVRVVGNKLIILGRNDYLTTLAADYFIEHYVNASDGTTLSVPGNLSYLGTPYAEPKQTEEQPEPFEEVTPSGDPYSLTAETWVAEEIVFESGREYPDPVYTVDTDVLFRNRSTGTVLKIPAFWNGGTEWIVRFALTEPGDWDFYSVCSDEENAGLHHRTGTVRCESYSGDLDIYRHGFVKTEYGKNYFLYDDGTPFFYLADTHWTLALEELDGYGSVETQKTAGITEDIALQYGITSQFTYIMDYRAGQGYTVIQSQPLGWWTNPGQNGWFADDEQNIFTYGVNDVMLEKFRQYDRYFAYIAKLGLVHSSTQFGYPTALMTEYFAGKITDLELEKLCRYWVARYGAYPVLWATTQEGDNDYYGLDRGDCAATPETNPWLLVMDYVAKYDAYGHPSTCHQENAGYTRVANSAFGPKEAHTWYAAQYSTIFENGKDTNWEIAREYYDNPGSKPVVNYEGRYDHFWIGTFGARAQGWTAYLNGQTGYGYGVQPIWSIFWSGNGIADFTGSDENGTFSMAANWVEGLYAEAGEQVTYIKDLLTQYEWWRLEPCFDGSYYYQPSGSSYAVSSIGSELYIGYFWGSGENTVNLGMLTGMKNASYTVTWFNCRTGESSESFTVSVTDGTYTLPAKPDDGDWAVTVRLEG